MPDDDFASIVIPTRDRAELLRRCIDSLRACTASPRYELVIVDNGSTDPEACALLARLERVVPAPGPFNFAALCNAGVQAARGRVVVLLNNDTVVTDGWLAELAALAIRPRVGAVGPLLVYEDGSPQSAGVFIGVNRTSTNVLAGCAPDSAIAREWCLRRRRVSAVMGACLAIERAKFVGAGGLDEAFAVSHNELDLCLRLERDGYANLFTPHARVIHVEGATRGYELTRAERARLEREEQAFRARWRDRVGGHDPAHNPNLARRGDPFALAPPGEVRHARAGWPGSGGAASRG